MKLTLLIVYFLFQSIFSYAQIGRNDTIQWRPDYKLKWDDFQGIPEVNSPQTAVSTCSFSFSFHRGDSGYIPEVVSYFNKKKSWVKKDTNSLDSNQFLNLLKHEQGHFNINYLYSLILIENLFKLNTKNASFIEKMKVLQDSIILERWKFNQDYDLETEHSKNEIEQRNWDVKISNLIINYINYSSFK